MSSFRVERQRVSLQAEIVSTTPSPAPQEDELAKAKKEIEEQRAQALHTQRYAEQFLEDARKEAQTILAEAQRQSEVLMSKTQAQAKELLEQERQLGYHNGWEQAQQEGERWKTVEMEKITQLSDKLEAEYQSKVDEVEKAATILAMEITEKIIGIQLDENDTAFLNVIHNAMARFRQDEDILVHLSDEDYQRYVDDDGVVHLNTIKKGKITFERDTSLQRGDCILENTNQFVDCGVSGQLNRVGRVLREVGDEDQGHEQDFAKVQGSLAQN